MSKSFLNALIHLTTLLKILKQKNSEQIKYFRNLNEEQRQAQQQQQQQQQYRNNTLINTTTTSIQ